MVESFRRLDIAMSAMTTTTTTAAMIQPVGERNVVVVVLVLVDVLVPVVAEVSGA